MLWTILHKLTFIFDAIPNQITTAFFFAEMNKLVLNFVSVHRTQIHKTILKKENKIGRLTLPDLKTYYRGSYRDGLVLAKG